MKKILLISGVLLALTATVASAGGINLYWNDCSAGAGATNRAFACNLNTGTNNLFISFDPAANIPDMNGSNPIIDLQSASDPMPPWWQFKNAGSCRLLNLASSTFAGAAGLCVDPWSGQGSAGIAAYYTNAVVPSMATNRTRILGSIAVPGAAAANVDPGTEYFDLGININNGKTTGLGSCGGCLDPVCLVLNEVLLTGSNTPDTRIFNPLQSNFATWQGGQISAPGCPAATPTVNKTWGQVKSIYR